MNWLDRARSELLESHQRHTANTAERAPMAVLAVLHSGITDPATPSNGSNSSTLPTQLFETASAQEEFEASVEHNAFHRGAFMNDRVFVKGNIVYEAVGIIGEYSVPKINLPLIYCR